MEISKLIKDLSNITGQVQQNNATGGLYEVIFGKNDIPLTLSLEPETRNALFITAGILAAGAVLTAILLKKVK